MAKVERTEKFKAQFKARANIPTKALFFRLIKVFMKNPHDKSLHRIHPLKHEKKEFWSWSLTDDEGVDDFRVIYKRGSKKEYIFVDFGTHTQLYRPWFKKT